MATSNPILDELAGLSPGAKAALAGAHSAGTSQAAIGTPPMQAPQLPAHMGSPAAPQMTMPMPGGAPSVPPIGATPQTPHPTIQAPRGTVEGDEQHRTELMSKPAGLESVYGKIAHSDFGENHPIAGKILGGLAQIPATVADIGLSGVVPRVGALVPGTSLQHGLQVQKANSQVAEDTGEREKAVQTQEAQARIPLENATTAKLQEETNESPEQAAERLKLEDAQITALLHPQAKTEFEAWRQENPTAPVADFLKLQAQNKPEAGGAKADLQRKLIAATNAGDTATAKKLQQQLKDIDPLAENRIAVTVQGQQNSQANHADAKTEKEFQYTRAKWDKDLQTYQTQNEKLAEAGDLIGEGAMGAALGSVKSLSGLAGGQGSGVRITQAELNSIAHARGFSGDFDAFLQRFGDGNKLTPQQVGDLKSIISDVQRIAGAKEAVINQGLDDLSNAKDTPAMRKIDSQLRHVLMGAQ